MCSNSCKCIFNTLGEIRTHQVLKSSEDSPKEAWRLPYRTFKFSMTIFRIVLPVVSTMARYTVKGRPTCLVEVPARIIPTPCARSAMLILIIFYVNTFLSNSTNSMSCTRNPSKKGIFGWTVLYMNTCFLSVNQTWDELMEYIAYHHIL